MKMPIFLLLSLLIIYIISQAIYSLFYFRRAGAISKTSFAKELELGGKNKPALRLTVYGDSVGAGVGATSFDTSLAGRLANYLAVDHHVIFKNQSVSGSKMADLIDAPEPSQKQDLILLVISSNDLFRFNNLGEFEKATSKVAQKYSNLADKIIIVGPGRVFDSQAIPLPARPVYKIQGPKYAQIIAKEIQNFKNIKYVNPIDPPVDIKNYRGKPSFDRFHPSDDDYVFWFDITKTAL